MFSERREGFWAWFGREKVKLVLFFYFFCEGERGFGFSQGKNGILWCLRGNWGVKASSEGKTGDLGSFR